MTAGKTLLVDWGGVLTVPLDHVWREASNRNPQQAQATRAAIDMWLAEDRRFGAGTSPLYLFETGRIGLQQFEFELEAAWVSHGFHESAEGFVATLMAPLAAANDRVFDVLAQWHQRGVRLVVASNSWGDLYDRSRWDIFDAAYISGEIGVRKPDPKFFETIVQELGLELADMGLIDDMSHNVLSAHALGMQGFLFTDTTTMQVEVERWLAGGQG